VAEATERRFRGGRDSGATANRRRRRRHDIAGFHLLKLTEQNGVAAAKARNRLAIVARGSNSAGPAKAAATLGPARLPAPGGLTAISPVTMNCPIGIGPRAR
jgi:hypothetical protein